MSIWDIYKARQLGYGESMFASLAGKALGFESFNKWNEEWEIGLIDDATGEPSSTATTTAIRSSSYSECIPDTTYYGYFGGSGALVIYWYDENKAYISGANITNRNGIAPNNAKYFKVRTTTQYGGTYSNNICINISGERNGEYEPYGEP